MVRLLAAASCILAATGLVVWTTPDVETAVGEVLSVRTDANLWDPEGWTAPGAIPSSLGTGQRVWVGTAPAGRVTPDVAPLDEVGAAATLALHKGPTPGELSDVLAMVEPVSGGAETVVGWRWSTVSSALNVEIVLPGKKAADSAPASPDRVRWWRRGGQQPLVAMLDDEHVAMAVILPWMPRFVESDDPCAVGVGLEVVPARMAESGPLERRVEDRGEDEVRHPAGGMDLSWVEVPSWCLSHGATRRYMALDPATGLVLEDGTRLGVMPSPKGDTTRRTWGICRDGTWERAEPGMSIAATGWTVRRCPGVGRLDGDMPAVEARWCDATDAECRNARYGWFAPKVGEVPVVIGGVLLARPGPGNSIGVSRYRHAESLSDPSNVLPALEVAGGTPSAPSGLADTLGDLLLPADTPVTLLVRKPGESGGNLLQVTGNSDARRPMLEATWLRSRYMPRQDVFGRAMAFSSVQPGTWRFRPERAVGRVGDGGARVLIPGIAEFRWDGDDWIAASDHVQDGGPVDPARAESRRFETAGHRVQVGIRTLNPYLNWVTFLAIAQVLACLAMAVFLAIGSNRMASRDAVAVWLAGLTIGALTGVGTMQIAVAGLSPLGQNSSLFLGGHLSWIVIGSTLAWLAACGIKGWRGLASLRRLPSEASTAPLLGAALLGAGPVALDGVFARFFLPEGTLASWSPTAILILGLSALAVVLIALRRWWHPARAWLAVASLMAIVGVLGLHGLAGRRIGSRVLGWVGDVGPWLSAFVLLLLLAGATWGAVRVHPLIVDAAGRIGARRRLHPALAGVAGAILLVVLPFYPGGAAFKATVPDAVAMIVCFALALRTFLSGRHAQDIEFVGRLGRWAALALFVSGFVSGDLGTTLVRTVAVLVTTWWCTYRLRGALLGHAVPRRWWHVSPPVVAILLAVLGAGGWTFLGFLVMVGVVVAIEIFEERHGGQRGAPGKWDPLHLVPLWLVGAFFAAMATRGLAGAIQRRLEAWFPRLASEPIVSNPLTRLVERDLCAGNTELWGFCEQLLDARRFWSTRLSDWPSDILASNMHSDLAWAHAVHLGSGLFWVLALAALSAVVVGVALAPQENRGRSRLNSAVVAGASGAAMVPLLSAALHVLGTRSIVPLSGVPWAFLSYANTTNALVVVFLAVLATVAWHRREVQQQTEGTRLAAVYAGTAFVLLLVGMVAWHSRPGHAMDWDREDAPVLLGSRDARKDEATLRMDTRESWEAVCDALISPVRLMGNEARAGASRLVGDRFVRLVQVDVDVTSGTSAEAPERAALVAGWFLPEDGPARSLCSDPSCDWFVDPAFGAALSRLAIEPKRRGRVSIRVEGRMLPEEAGIRRRASAEPGPRNRFDFEPIDVDALRNLVDRAGPYDLDGFRLETTNGHYVVVPVRIDTGRMTGTALCVAAGPHVTLVSNRRDEGPLKVGLWPQAGHSSLLAALPEEDCGASGCAVRLGWPSRWAMRAPLLKRYAVDLRQAAWQQVGAHSSAGMQWERLAVPGRVGPAVNAGLGLQGLAAHRSDTPDGRRMIRASLARMLAHADALAMAESFAQCVLPPPQEGVTHEATCEDRYPRHRAMTLAQEIARPSSDPAVIHRPPRPRRASLVGTPTTRLEVRWVDRLRSFGAPLLFFQAPTSMGVGRPVAFTSREFFMRQLPAERPGDSSDHRAILRLPTPRPVLRLQGRWRLGLGLAEPQSGASGQGDPPARLDPVATLAGRTEPGRDTVVDLAIDTGGDSPEAWRATVADRAEMEWEFHDEIPGWKGWLAHVGPLAPAPDTPRAQASRTQRRSTAVVVRDLLADLDVFASSRSTRLTLDADAQAVMEHELLGWLSDAMYAASDAGMAPDGTFRATGVLVDYERRVVLAVGEAVGSGRMAADYNRAMIPPLLVDGDIEAASTLKPISALLGAPDAAGAPASSGSDVSAFPCPHEGSDGASQWLPNCHGPGGNIDIASAVQESCNHFFPRWILAHLSDSPDRFLAQFERVGLFGPMTRVSGLPQDFVFDLDARRRFQFETGGLVPRRWAGALARMRLEEPWQVVPPRPGDEASRRAAERVRLGHWANGLHVHASPWWVASVYADLAAAVRGVDSATETGGFRWLRFDSAAGESPSLESERVFGRIVRRVTDRGGASPVVQALLNGMAGSLQFGTGSDDPDLAELSKRFHLVGKTGTSEDRRTRHWQHLVSLVDPRSPLSRSRPWLLWVTVEQTSDRPSKNALPHVFRPTRLAARLWAALGGEPVR